MNSSNDNHDPTTRDDLHDRLVDRGLAEVVGRETPPDLRERILAVSVPAKAANIEAPRTRPSRAFWASLAALLLVSLTISTLSLTVSSRFLGSGVAVRNAAPAQAMDRTAQETSTRDSTPPSASDASAPPLPSPYYLTDDVQYFAPQTAPGRNFRIEASPETEVHRYAEQFQRNSAVGRHDLIYDAHAVPATESARTSLSAATTRDSRAPEGKSAEFPKFTADLVKPFRQGSFATDQINTYDTETPYSDPNAREDVLRPTNKSVAGPDATQWAHLDPNHVGVQFRSAAPHVFFDGGEAHHFRIPGQAETDEGTGPGLPGDQYTRIVENPFVKAEGGAAVSTFSIDVDTASYTNVRQFLMQMNTLPPPDAVRIEELINYFDYAYAPPTDAVDAADPPTAPGSAGGSSEPGTRAASSIDSAPAPFAAHVEVAGCPWALEHRLVRIGIKGRELDRNKRPKSNLVFLVDVSGSMDEPSKLPLVVYGLQQLTRELGENDRVAIVVYASSEGLVLSSTTGDKQDTILAALGRLQAGGSTAGGAGIQLAYQLAEDNFIEGGTNRVILCTDGDFNVGVTSTAELERLVEQKAKDTGVFLSVLGFGRGNLNDAMMETIADNGNGNYSYVDNRTEARRVLVEEMSGTLVTIAKDVKIQVEFNPRQVAGYRLIGYENRLLRTEDFNDDRKDAGEIGAGHTVTALYEIVPAGKPVAIGPVDDLKYQQPVGRPILPVEDQAKDESDDQSDKIVRPASDAADITRELLTLKMRYKQPDGDTSRKLEWPIRDEGQAFSAATGDFQFAAAVAGFGLVLRDSQYKGSLTYAAVLELAQSSVGADEHGYRSELVDMIRRAEALRGE